MTPDIKNEHAIETYKSLINISVAGLKLLALLPSKSEKISFIKKLRAES
jgi:hypothetical protein